MLRLRPAFIKCTGIVRTKFNITLMGGVIGIVLGILGAMGVCSIAGVTAGGDPAVVIIATLFSCGVGIFFGIYPARKAAKLSPIEALRHE